MHQSINTDSKNSKEPQQKNRLGMVSIKILGYTYTYKYTYLTIQAANNKGADQTVRMRRLICAFVVCIWHKTRFRMTWPKYYLRYDEVRG